jgi:hypothetical protein
VAGFLAEFGGLVVNERFARAGEVLTVDPVLAVSGIHRERVEEYEEFLGVELVPVGDGCTGHLAVMITPDGAFFGGFDDCLVRLGDSAFEMVGKLDQGGGEVLR